MPGTGESAALLRGAAAGTEDENTLDNLWRFYQQRNPSLTFSDFLKFVLFAIIFITNELFYMPAVGKYAEREGRDDFYRWREYLGLSLGVLALSYNAAYELIDEFHDNKAPGRTQQSFAFILITAIYSAFTTTATAYVESDADTAWRLFVAGLIFVSYSTVHTLSTRSIDNIPWLKGAINVLLFPPYFFWLAREYRAGRFKLHHHQPRVYRDLDVYFTALQDRLRARCLPIKPFSTNSHDIDSVLADKMGEQGLSGLEKTIEWLYTDNPDAFKQALKKAYLAKNMPLWQRRTSDIIGGIGGLFAVGSCVGFFEAPLSILRETAGDSHWFVYGLLLYYLAFIPDMIVAVLLLKYGGKIYSGAFDAASRVVQGSFTWNLGFHLYFKSALLMLPVMLTMGQYSDAPVRLYIENGSSEGIWRDLFLFSGGIAGNGAFYMMTLFVTMGYLFELLGRKFADAPIKTFVDFCQNLQKMQQGSARLSEESIATKVDILCPQQERLSSESRVTYSQTSFSRFFRDAIESPASDATQSDSDDEEHYTLL